MSALSVLIDNISKEKELEDDTLKLLQTLNTKSTNLQKSIKQINNSRSHNQLKYNIRDQLQRDLIATYKQYEEVFTLDKSAPIVCILYSTIDNIE